MKLLIEVEIEADPGEYASIRSVKCNGSLIGGEEDSIGRSDGIFYKIPTGEELLSGSLELVKWEE